MASRIVQGDGEVILVIEPEFNPPAKPQTEFDRAMQAFTDTLAAAPEAMERLRQTALDLATTETRDR